MKEINVMQEMNEALEKIEQLKITLLNESKQHRITLVIQHLDTAIEELYLAENELDQIE